MSGKQKPRISVANRQRMLRVGLSTLREFAERALTECVRLPARKSAVLRELSDVNVVLVSDRRMAALHRQFLKEAGPTDVITFHHGEIFISTETAKRQAKSFGTSLEHELRLYIAHGLLHLHGFQDRTAAGVAEMNRVQKKIVTAASLP